MVPLKSGQISLPNITLLWEKYSKVMGIAPIMNGANPSSPKATQDTANIPTSPGPAAPGAPASTTSPGVMSSPVNGFNGSSISGIATQGHPPQSLLVEIGYPADLRYIFVKPSEIHF